MKIDLAKASANSIKSAFKDAAKFPSTVHLVAPDSAIQSIECELKYLVDPAAFLSALDLSAYPLQQISQSYFKKETLPLITAVVFDRLKYSAALAPELFTSGRLRHLRSKGVEKFSLDIKGAKRGSLRAVRPELSVPISGSLYNQLLHFATSGEIHKIRTLVTRTMPPWSPRESGGTCEVHCDAIVAAGTNVSHVRNWKLPKQISQLYRRSPFIFVDVEISVESQLRRLLAASHSLEFLQSAILLNDLPRKSAKVFSSRRIAREGITARTIGLAQSLLY